jgi:hypothetical protein
MLASDSDNDGCSARVPAPNTLEVPPTPVARELGRYPRFGHAQDAGRLALKTVTAGLRLQLGPVLEGEARRNIRVEEHRDLHRCSRAGGAASSVRAMAGRAGGPPLAVRL